MSKPEAKPQAERKKSPAQIIKEAHQKASRVAMGKSFLLHAVILASILISINFSDKPLEFVNAVSSPAQAAPIVKATFIDSNVIAQQQREKAQAEAAAQQRERRRVQAERDRAERERKRRAEDARKQREAEQQKEQERLNALEEQRIKEQAAAAQRAEEERKQRELEEMKRALEQEMSEQLAQEQAAQNAANQKRVMTEVERYNVLMIQKIQRNLNLDGAFKGSSCLLNLRLASDGLILSVKVLEGDPALCRAAQAAALKASSVPMSNDPDVYDKLKNTNMTIRPNS
jgi:colicin import membrane protein